MPEPPHAPRSAPAYVRRSATCCAGGWSSWAPASAPTPTVGIDAILNVKGFAGDKGLEYYRELRVVNLGAQVSVPQLVARAQEEQADAVLVAQVVTQRDAHLHNTREMAAAFREAYPAERRPVLVVGGPRFDEGGAAQLGVDRVFARGTTPADVAS